MLCQDQEDEAREGRDLAGREAIMAGRDFTGLPRRPRRAGPTGITAGEDAAVSPLSSPSWALWGRFLLSSCNPGKRSPFSIPQQKEAARWGRLFLCYDSSTANWLL